MVRGIRNQTAYRVGVGSLALYFKKEMSSNNREDIGGISRVK
jgi:hypothetical protein